MHWSAGLDEAQWGLATASPGWTVRDQVSHLWFFDQRALMATDRSGRVLRRCRSGSWRRVVPRHRSHPAERSPGPNMLERVARRSGAAASMPHVASMPSTAGAVVRPGDGCSFVHHGAADGDVGARPGRVDASWCRASSRRIGSATSPTSACAPGRSAMRSDRCRCPKPTSTSRSRTPSGETRHLGLAGGDRLGAWPDARLLPCRHAASPSRPTRRSRSTAAAAEEWMSIAQAFAGDPGPGRQPGQFG